MNVRKYEPSDHEDITEITVQVFEPVSRDAAIERRFGLLNGVSWQERKTATIDADFKANPDGMFVAEAGGQLLGFITTTIDQHTRTGHIVNMAVGSDWQGRGIGKALLTAALDYFERCGMIYAKIETLTTNKVGQTFYPAVGFQETARMIHYFMRLADRQDL